MTLCSPTNSIGVISLILEGFGRALAKSFLSSGAGLFAGNSR
jgi:hypothetical protein